MTVTLKASKRGDYKRSITKQLREIGQVPGIVYGKGKATKSIAVNSIELVKTLRDEGRNAIIQLDIENDKPVEVMLHEYQMDPIKDSLVHVDFYIVDMSEEMDVQVPIRLEGEAQGSKEGGVLQQPIFELTVRAKPNQLPDEILVNVTNMNIGDVISVADLPKSDKYAYVEDEDTTVATILAPSINDDLEGQTDADANAEPELVGSKQENKNAD